MNALTSEWVEKAEGDYRSAWREVRARRDPNYDDACFHAQQCAEKYLKAHLQEAGIPFQRTHDLVALLDLCHPLRPAWDLLRDDLRLLNAYAVDVRYPGQTATAVEARQAVHTVRRLRVHFRTALGLAP